MHLMKKIEFVSESISFLPFYRSCYFSFFFFKPMFGCLEYPPNHDGKLQNTVFSYEGIGDWK